MIKARIVLHVGLPFTGEKILQNRIFPMMKNILYLGSGWFINFRELFYPDEDSILISNEYLLGSPFDRRPKEWRSRFETNARLLARRLGRARIILSVREQSELVTGWYREHLASSKPRAGSTQARFSDDELDLVEWKHLHYVPLIEVLEENFARVMIVLVESAECGRERLVADLERYTGGQFEGVVGGWPTDHERQSPEVLPDGLRESIRDHYVDDWKAVRARVRARRTTDVDSSSDRLENGR